MNNKAVIDPHVLIVDRCELVRAGLRTLLRERLGFTKVTETSDGQNATRIADVNGVDLVVIDIDLPTISGIQASANIVRKHPDAKVLILTSLKNRDYVARSFKVGVHGYCLKEAAAAELTMAVTLVLRGENYVSSGVANHVVQACVEADRKQRGQDSKLLTARECEVIRLVTAGHTNRAISGMMSISVKTVEKHRSNLMKKLGLHTAVDVARYAIEHGLARIEDSADQT